MCSISVSSDTGHCAPPSAHNDLRTFHYSNWWPLFVVATYVLAPVPNALCARCAGGDDLMSDYHSGAIDAGEFITGIFIVTGFCLPLVLAHAEVITIPAMVMSIIGGILVYGTIIAYTHFFANEGEDF
ncbi:Vacuolar protein sorting-associated protein 55 [Umbelopsis nana]